jgi:AraC-like DNA-binding protein
MPLDDPYEQVAWIQMPQHGGWEYLIAHRSRHLWTVHHETYTICSSHEYGQTWRYRGRTHTLPQSGCMLIEPGELHRTLQLPGGVSFKVALIPPEEVERAAFELGLRGVPHLRMAQSFSPQLTESVWRLGLAIEDPSRMPLELECLQAQVVHNLLQHAERAPVDAVQRTAHPAVSKARSYLLECLDEPVTLEHLANVAGISRYRLVSLFTREVGLSPHAYQLQLRILRARKMLTCGIPGSQVAVTLGFVDQAHFIRHFKRIMKVTPGAYLRELAVPATMANHAR